MWAADAASNPNPQALKDSDCLFIARYVGTAYQRYGVSRDYIDWCHGVGIGVVLIFEEWSSQFLGGYDAAVQCCNRMMVSWDALGAPRDGSVIPAVVILDPNPSAAYGNEGALQDFARGWNDSLPFDQFTGYGSRYALDLAGEVAPKMTRRWGVGTWGYGERSDGSLPDNVPADMIQHGNIGAPVPGCDYNTLFRTDMGQWGGQGTTPKKEEDPTMWCAVIVTDRVHAYAVAGNTILWEFGGAPGYVGIPQEALDSGLRCVRVDNNGSPGDSGWDRLTKASEFSLVDPRDTVTVEVGGVTDAQKAAVEASIQAGKTLDQQF